MACYWQFFFFFHETRFITYLSSDLKRDGIYDSPLNKQHWKAFTYIRAFYCRVRRQKLPCFHAVAFRSRCVKRSAAASSIHAAARRSRRTATLPYPPCRRQGNRATSANHTPSSPISPWQLPHRSSTFLANLSNCVQHALRVAPRYSFEVCEEKSRCYFKPVGVDSDVFDVTFSLRICFIFKGFTNLHGVWPPTSLRWKRGQMLLRHFAGETWRLVVQSQAIARCDVEKC